MRALASESAEVKASRALASARAFLNRSPVRVISDTSRERLARASDDDAPSARATTATTVETTTVETTTSETSTEIRDLRASFANANARETHESARDDERGDDASADDDALVSLALATPTSIALDLSSDSASDGDGKDDRATARTRALEARALEASALEARALEASALENERLRRELEHARWEREALEVRAFEAEANARALEANAREVAKEITGASEREGTGTGTNGGLTAENAAALAAELEQMNYLKRLLARAESMRNAARAETKQARAKHERDLEILRAELVTMDEEMENLRRRVKKDRAKIEAMERATIDAADEFRTLYRRQTLTQRLLVATFVAFFAVLTRLALDGRLGTMKNMYRY